MNPGAVESALAAPFAGWGEADLYPDIATKAAVLCSRLLRNHPLVDGNKRVAYESMRELIARNGCRWLTPHAEVAAEMVERLAAREIGEEHFASWVARHVSLPKAR